MIKKNNFKTLNIEDYKKTNFGVDNIERINEVVCR